MNYPTISEYIEAIKSAKDNFDALWHLCPVLNEDGEPVMSIGNFAVVFKMKDEETGELHAVKCFLREQEGRTEAYQMIAEELKYVNSTFLTPIMYLDKELFVDTNASDKKKFPILLMDWVEGMTLDKYIREHMDNQYELALLAYKFSRLAMWLMPQPFAHGDLKPDNILVRNDGALVLVDYDGMYVPAMKGQNARELGSPDFRHPSRTENDFNEHIDDFSLASILLSLKAISLKPLLLEEYGALDRLLFSESDYHDFSQCKLLKYLFPPKDSEMRVLISLFTLALEKSNLSCVSSELFYLNMPKEYLNTKFSLSDEYGWKDECGVEYSHDKKRLLNGSFINVEKYTVLSGVLTLCDSAFEMNKELTSIDIPDSVIKIGKCAFYGCLYLTSVTFGNSVESIGYCAFGECHGLSSIVIPDSVTSIGKSAFCRCAFLKTVKLGEKVERIGEGAFADCVRMSSVFISKSVTNIGEFAFSGCKNLESIVVDPENSFFDSRDNSNAIIETATNTLITGCKNTIIPDSVTAIGEDAFSECNELSFMSIPNSVSHIGHGAFSDCKDLITVFIPISVKSIGNSVFWGCCNLKTIFIPSGTKERFEKILPEYKEKLVEINNISSIRCKS